MKCIAFALLAGACAPCLAQSPTTLMPEGSRETSVGVMMGSLPASEGSRKRNRVLFPFLRIQWSNGVFINNLSAGMHLSRTPNLRYGPLVEVGGHEARDPAERDERRLLVGGFAEYALLHNVRISALVLHGGARGGGGNTLELAARTWMSLAPHHSGSLELGLNLADGRYMDSHFGDAASAGIKDTFLVASWNWEMSRKFQLYTGVKASQLSGNASNGRFVATRGGVQLLTALSYRF